MGVRGAPLSEIDRFFGALTPHARVIQAADSYPELSPLSTHSKKASRGFLAKALRLLGNDMRTAHRITRSTWSYSLAAFTGSGVYCLLSSLFHSKHRKRSSNRTLPVIL